MATKFEFRSVDKKVLVSRDHTIFSVSLKGIYSAFTSRIVRYIIEKNVQVFCSFEKSMFVELPAANNPNQSLQI